MRGGYKILDFKKVNITIGTAAVIEGVYEALATNTGKPTVLTNLVVASHALCSAYVYFKLVGEAYLGYLDSWSITITKDNKVTFTATEATQSVAKTTAKATVK